MILTFPKKVPVTFVIPFNLASNIRSKDFVVEVRYDDIQDDSLQKWLPLHLVKTPPMVYNATMKVGQVDYLIEKQ